MNTILIEHHLILNHVKNVLNTFGDVNITGAYSSVSELIFSDDIELIIITPDGYNLEEYIALANSIKSEHNSIKIAAFPMFYDESIYKKLLAEKFDIILWKGSPLFELKNAFQNLKKGVKYFSKQKEVLN